MSTKMPTKWEVPDGYVLTWYPPFVFPYPVAENRQVFVYDDVMPFVPVEGPDGEIIGYNANVSMSTLDQYENGEHPGQYALNRQGEEPGFDPDNPVHKDAVQVFGKKVSS